MGSRVENLAAGLTMTGRARRAPPKGQAMHAHEIEPGRPVPNHWDDHLFETWAVRKARRAAERLDQDAKPTRCKNPVERGRSMGAAATTGDSPVAAAPHLKTGRARP